MSFKNDFDDDYVARLLAEDAKKTSKNYSTSGLSAFLPKQRRADGPKPNTRFLSHIVREADQHNAALKQKEALEARRRLRALHGSDDRLQKRRHGEVENDRQRGRLFGAAIAAAQGEQSDKYKDRSRTRNTKRRRQAMDGTADEDERKDQHPRRHHSRDHVEREHRTSRLSRRLERSAPLSEASKSDDSDRGDSRKHVSRRQRERRHSTRRDRSLSDPPDSDDTDHKKAQKHKRRRRRTHSPSRSPPQNSNKSREPSPPLKRGRGAHNQNPHTTTIDDRFTPTYDPALDIHPDSDAEGEDWDFALEAMRDRAKYMKNRASRLREAGFGEHEIRKWEGGLLSGAGAAGGEGKHGDGNGEVGNVKWAEKGKVREWDLGKKG